MNFINVEFEKSVGLAKQLDPSNLPEIVFSGKSNVGKSSLINKLLNRKAIARVSASPGKTATINFYKLDEFRLVDLPGYGYAKVSKAEKQRWAELVEGYFAQERDIKLIVQILDARHKPTQNDIDMLNFLIGSERDFLVVCTKSDKLNKTETEKQRKVFDDLFSENEIEYIFFSATKGTGLDEIREAIDKALNIEDADEAATPAASEAVDKLDIRSINGAELGGNV